MRIRHGIACWWPSRPQGRLVAALARGWWEAGEHAVAWDRRDAKGSAVRPGVYIYRLAAGVLSAQRKMVLLP